MIKNLIFYSAVVGVLLKFDILDRRPLRAFLNMPFEIQMKHFLEFQKFHNKYIGKINMIQIYLGGEPYVSFTREFFHNTTNVEQINLKDHKEHEIVDEFIKRGFKVDVN